MPEARDGDEFRADVESEQAVGKRFVTDDDEPRALVDKFLQHAPARLAVYRIYRRNSSRLGQLLHALIRTVGAKVDIRNLSETLQFFERGGVWLSLIVSKRAVHVHNDGRARVRAQVKLGEVSHGHILCKTYDEKKSRDDEDVTQYLERDDVLAEHEKCVRIDDEEAHDDHGGIRNRYRECAQREEIEHDVYCEQKEAEQELPI